MKKSIETKNYTLHSELVQLTKALNEYGVKCVNLTRSYMWCMERDEIYYGIRVTPKEGSGCVDVHLYDSKKYEFSRGQRYGRELTQKRGTYAEERKLREAGLSWLPEWTMLVEYHDVSYDEDMGREATKECFKKYELSTKNLAHKIFSLLGSSIKAANFELELERQRAVRRENLERMAQDLGFKNLHHLEMSPLTLSLDDDGTYSVSLARFYDLSGLTADEVKEALSPLVTLWRKREAQKEKENDDV